MKISIALYAIILLFLCSCSKQEIDEEKPSQYAETGDYYIILNSEIDKKIKESQNGNGDSSYKLFLHYSFVSEGNIEKEKALYYLRVAAGQGNKKAIKLLNRKNKESS